MDQIPLPQLSGGNGPCANTSKLYCSGADTFPTNDQAYISSEWPFSCCLPINNASVVEIAVAHTTTLWCGVVQQLDFLKDESEAKHLGTVAGIGIECPPLGVQLVPVGSLENLEGVDVLHHTYEKAYRELSKHCVASSFTQNSATIEHPCARTFSCSNISAAAWLHWRIWNRAKKWLVQRFPAQRF